PRKEFGRRQRLWVLLPDQFLILVEADCHRLRETTEKRNADILLEFKIMLQFWSWTKIPTCSGVPIFRWAPSPVYGCRPVEGSLASGTCLLYDHPGVSHDILLGPCLTLSVTASRPTETFQVHSKPQQGGDAVEHRVRRTP